MSLLSYSNVFNNQLYYYGDSSAHTQNYTWTDPMVILTAVYVLATIIIVIYSHRSINVAKSIQHQNIKLQLFNQRYEIYLLLNSWYEIAKEMFSENPNLLSTESKKSIKQIFIERTYKGIEGFTYSDSEDLTKFHGNIFAYINHLTFLEDEIYNKIISSVGTSEAQKKLLERSIETIKSKRKNIFNYLNSLGADLNKLNSLVYFYGRRSIPIELVKNFGNYFFICANELNENSFKDLKDAFNKSKEAKIIENIEMLLEIDND